MDVVAPQHHQQTIVIAGKPAGGKSTQCKKLLDTYGFVHISAGDLLRSRQNVMPELAKYMDNGLLVPDHIVCSIVQNRLLQRDCQTSGVLLDGFPRTPHQAKVLKEMGVKVDHFILLDVPDRVVVERISGRRVDPVSGSTYHIKVNPPKDRDVAKRLIQRKDDTKEKIQERLVAYHANVKDP